MSIKRGSIRENINSTREEVNQLADSLAEAISSLNSKRVASLFHEDTFTTYISDGAVIPLNKLEETLERFYCSLKSLEFKWDKKEVYLINETCAMLMGWTTYFSYPLEGEPGSTNSVFTFLCVKRGGRWGFLVAHKSSTK